MGILVCFSHIFMYVSVKLEPSQNAKTNFQLGGLCGEKSTYPECVATWGSGIEKLCFHRDRSCFSEVLFITQLYQIVLKIEHKPAIVTIINIVRPTYVFLPASFYLYVALGRCTFWTLIPQCIG